MRPLILPEPQSFPTLDRIVLWVSRALDCEDLKPFAGSHSARLARAPQSARGSEGSIFAGGAKGKGTSRDYPLRAYMLHAAAVPHFDATFHKHVASQEQNYLTNHTLAKAHGKLKTANLRFGPQVHFREQARLGCEPGDWSLVLSDKAPQTLNPKPQL